MSIENQIPNYKTVAKPDGLWIMEEAEISQELCQSKTKYPITKPEQNQKYANSETDPSQGNSIIDLGAWQ